MGLINKTSGMSLFFKTHFGIHTFFMKYPIDVLILDQKNKVVYLKEGLKPNRFFFWNPIYNNVIELPEDTVKKQRINLGNKIQLKLLKL